MTSFLSRCVLAALVLVTAACSQNSNTAKPAGGAGVVVTSCENGDTVVGRMSGKDIKLKDVDEKIADQLKQVDKQKLQLRQQTIESMIIEELVKAEAKKAGKTDEEWLKENIDAKVPPPAEEAIQKLYAENQSQMPPGTTLEAVRPRIIEFLTKDARRDVAVKLFNELKKAASAEVLLQEPRVQVEAKGPMRGPNDAKVTIVEFSDFECPFCGRAEETVEKVMTTYAGKIKLVYRHYPLPFHPNAQKAAEAAACADEQGKFWELQKQLFQNQKALSVDQLKGYAQQLGLDATRFNECLDSGTKKALVEADQEAGKKAGVSGTPAFFINGVFINGAQPFENFQEVIDKELGG